MERLLCGDVGFGKTEVALRAAFKCIGDGKQCAILVPTTVLAWQHYQTVLKRMEGFDIRVELLSRFRTAKEQKIILKKLEEGELDLVVGTHRLVQDDVKFKDLGLVIIDEEQRFGVNDKEKLKEAFTNVDVLTLSATPIPRTLNMAMSGIRDMSVIETPPGDRHPITTYVVEHDRGVIAQAINKELRRNGQVYYVHNRIESIYSCAADIHSMVPEANIGIAHGRMSEEELLDVWRRLIEGEIDVLVCTTLIETGVDVPNCNTLIIENADCMGLAQLHQLRGRVGRTNRRAYAYFTFRRGKVLSEIATKRLDAIREFTRFGSGFRIAMKDLEIRGAGSVLGQSQSGHLASVGYDMYIKLLNEAILEQQGKAPEITPECLIDIRIDAFIPEKYISNQAQRVDCYRKIAMIENDEDAYDVTDELIDRYGDVPRAVEGLIEVAKLRRIAQKMHLTEIIQSGDVMIFYPEKTDKKTMERVSAVGGKFGKDMMLNIATDKPNFRVNGTDKHGGPLALLADTLAAMQSIDKDSDKENVSEEGENNG
jgi:transcription-repair coupling factor (superfamily II helicase)